MSRILRISQSCRWPWAALRRRSLSGSHQFVELRRFIRAQIANFPTLWNPVWLFRDDNRNLSFLVLEGLTNFIKRMVKGIVWPQWPAPARPHNSVTTASPSVVLHIPTVQHRTVLWRSD